MNQRPHATPDSGPRVQERIAEAPARVAARMHRVESILSDTLDGHASAPRVSPPWDSPAGGEVARGGYRPLPGAGAPRLLVVDTTEASRAALAYLLRDTGYAVCDVAGVREIPDGDHPAPALVILDPGPSLPAALATIGAMTSRPGWSAVRILLVGSTAAGSEREGALAARCVGRLAKPCRPAELIAAVERIAGSATARAAMAALLSRAAARG